MIFKPPMSLPQKEEGGKYVFLAGSIDLNLSGNWRQYVINELGIEINFIDPTHPDHDYLDDEAMKSHIQWELDALALSDRILLNLLPNTESPISLIELGLYTFSNKLIVVCPDDFYKSRYIKVLCEKYSTSYFQNLDQGMRFLKSDIQ